MFLLVLCCWIMFYRHTQQHVSAHLMIPVSVIVFLLWMWHSTSADDLFCSIFTQDANKNQKWMFYFIFVELNQFNKNKNFTFHKSHLLRIFFLCFIDFEQKNPKCVICQRVKTCMKMHKVVVSYFVFVLVWFFLNWEQQYQGKTTSLWDFFLHHSAFHVQ